jgi:hypothetical protein
VFPARYELNIYVLCRRNSVFKGLNCYHICVLCKRNTFNCDLLMMVSIWLSLRTNSADRNAPHDNRETYWRLFGRQA